MKRSKKITIALLVIILIAVGVLLGIKLSKTDVKAQGYVRSLDLAPEHTSFEPITNPFPENTDSISYTYFRANIATGGATASYILQETKNKGIKIRFDTAQELHHFSVDVSPFPGENYAQAATLMQLDYILGNDINYIDVTGNRFIPIGYHYEDEYGLKSSTFSGTFDGRGFEITNLYLADYDELVLDFGEADVATTPYYSMFAFNSGTIKNFGLINPQYKLQYAHENITKAAHIVGENTGLVENVFATYNGANKGMSIRTVYGQTISNYEAAGIVFHNKGNGIVRNVYYASDVVIDPVYLKNFKVQPVVYTTDNLANVTNAIYDSTRYLLTVTSGGQTFNVTTPQTPPNTGKSTSELKNNGFGAHPNWFYYPNYRYPALFGLHKDGDNYVINNTVQFIYFNKLLRLNYIDNFGVNYRFSQYKLLGNIDMREVSPKAYISPLRVFDGILDGNDKFLGYFNMTKGTTSNQEYYTGLFSTLSGEVKNLTIVEANIDLDNDEAPNFNHHIGILAGTISNGIVSDVSIQGKIKVNQKIPRNLYLGLLAGDASGQISNVYIDGDITSNVIYEQNNVDGIVYHIGGIIGSTVNQQLKLDNILHIGDIATPTSTLSVPFNKSLTVNVGGVIGNVTNTTTTNHKFRLITHVGIIETKNISTTQAKFYIGGVIGDANGEAFIVNDQHRKWTHRGTIYNNISGVNTTNKIVEIAGVLNSNLDAPNEYLGLHNYDLEINTETLAFKDLQTNTNLIYIPIVNSRSTSGITLSQSSNDSNLVFNYDYPYHGVVRTNGPSLLRFLENYGSVTFQNFTYNRPLTIAGISLSPSIDYANVVQEAEIKLVSLTNGTTTTNYTNIINVAGFTNELASGRYIKNSYNKGNIIIANIQNHYCNIYVAGLVNHNYSGDLHVLTGNAPKATVGVINSVNYGKITSTLNSSTYGIHGRGNTYVGGLVTSNHGSIQDSINHGDLTVYNSYSNPTIQFETSSEFGGRIRNYQSGVVVGGVAALIGSGNSRVYDTSNGGDIVALSTGFVRAGGVVAIALLVELTAGRAQAYGTSTIDQSIISNGINYGTVVGLTSYVVEYGTGSISKDNRLFPGNSEETTHSNLPNSTSGTEQRPGIHASVGGVIGYGLSEMRRMINHGQIVSTDVAGGVVGATFVYNTSGTTYVKIDTAINYGSVRAYKKVHYANFDKINFNLNNLSTYLYAPNDDDIIPQNVPRDELRRHPRHKRGIGGVFGRLQRGTDQYMVGDGTEGSQFDFIVNMNPDVDLIGRLDQVYAFSSSLRFFSFGNAKYYSAKENDMTQGVFTGYYYLDDGTNMAEFYYSWGRLRQRWVVSRVYVSEVFEYTYNRIRYREYNDTDGNRYRIKEGYGTARRYYSSSNNINIKTVFYTAGNQRSNMGEVSIISGGGNPTTYGGLEWWPLGKPELVSPENLDLGTAYFPQENGVALGTNETRLFADTTEDARTRYATYMHIRDVPRITESPTLIADAFYVYHPSFEMRNDKVILSNGEEITSYINFAENAVLGERFVSTRPNGMYVLASTAGSTYGEVLPINTTFSKLLRLNGCQPYNIDYEDLSYREIIELDEDERYLKYKNLFQVALNDKSALIPPAIEGAKDEFSIRDKQRPIELVQPTIDHNNKTITFDFNMALVEEYQTGLDFSIVLADLPFKAFIAAPYSAAVHPPDAAVFIETLRDEREANPNQIASLIYPPNLLINFASYPAVFIYQNNKYNVAATSSPATLEIGTFRSYSEAALASTSLMQQEFTYTDYTVFVRFIRATTPNIRPISYRVDSGTTVNIGTGTPINNIVVSTPIVNTFLVNHRDSSSILNEGTDIREFIKLYYQNTSTVVDPQYYTLETTPVSSTGNFSMTITFGDQLRGGTYYIGYKYYSGDTEKYFQVTNANSQSNSILALHQRGLDEIYNPSYPTFSSTVPLLYTVTAADALFQEHTIPDVPGYLNNKYYTIGLLNNFEISPFASLTNVGLITNYQANGYIQYIMEYEITNEAGVARTYTHEINEQEAALVARYINGAITYDENLVAPREADETTFEFLYNIDAAYEDIFYNLNNLDDIYLEVVSLNGLDATRYSVDNMLSIKMLAEDLPGNYDFTISLKRKTDTSSYISLNLGNQRIIKAEGVSSYLTSIAFGEPGTELSYPTIGVLRASQTTPIRYLIGNENEDFDDVDNSFEAFVYYAGIDYDGADTLGKQHFRIIGEVDNVNLNDFLPRMIEFLPIGATIQRLKYDESDPYGSTYTWTVPVDADSPSADIAQLATDFTVYPTDGTEPGDLSETDVIITYRVTSEDGQSETYYYVSVVDATYNITFIFDVFYDDGVNPPENVNYLPKFYTFPMRFQIAIMETGGSITEFKLPDNFPDFNNISKFDYHISIYYQPLNSDNYGNYTFRFARNRAGYYQFILDIPNTYTYTMSYNGYPLADVSDYVSGVPGKYFYINQGMRNRTRRIRVVIQDNPDYGWGLNEHTTTYTEPTE